MNKALVLLGLACCLLVQQANGGCLSKLLSSDAKVGFDGLNKWLMRRLPEVEAPDKNLAEVKKNLGNLRGPKVERAAEIFVKFLETNECNDNLLKMAIEMAADQVDLGGTKRTERVLASNLDDINALCGPYVVNELESLYKNSLASELAVFLEVVVLEPHDWHAPIGADFDPEAGLDFLKYIGQEESRVLDPENWQWRQYLNRLAKDDPKAVVYEKLLNVAEGQYKTTYHRENFNYAFNKYLVEPCKLLTNTLGEPIKGLYALGDIQRKFNPDSYDHLMKHRSIADLQLLYGYKACQSLLTLKSSKINAISLFVDL